ncbi:50S ribosomal protein L24 [Candidatus Falkowbacteria bacterium RIFOXYD2_FULL_35_9]|uniref:Large ribosomal subunit protein uL24 n=1 Tax=Candidatus Falkowbacteria bacterium RIFOXYC2_FULL_36_12 TaxID=1798002 RepID=A0A1F5SXL7_9BACT|nr:MAG: 50S ribosomal protein L24 [Candidatus Falkowbacteria bacterium RIFOXYB2_FULL_35_7]OGF30971.1 MAG: 50S ribosomal protein L24 [Candidatus Falkowbacteria bacterium RIFOXYC2_FULL_36_12]OGF34399.1 MAG: 50S ribosomal protein L24 [Candidatus Falkowbacteria bacterium RIFOXYA2_FULL_35_8]OGF47296.1 MAG: 50S ribosomal protein L24 [Candidatus Falkowbacteria bacterium RIFOXYD2_FULL_35_9]
MKQKIKTGDKVKIIAGKDRHKKTAKNEKTTKENKGKVIQVLPELNKVVVEGLNERIKHMKPRKSGETGQKITYPSPLDISNVMLICPKCNKSTRVGFKVLETDQKGKKKIRICKKCNESIDS